MHTQRLSQSAFTLVELLVVIAIVGLLAGLAVPAIGKARETGDRAKCASNMRQLSSLYLTMVAAQDGVLVASSGGGNTWYSELEKNNYITRSSGKVNPTDVAMYKTLSCPRALAVLGGKYNVTRATYGLNSYIASASGPTRIVQVTKPSATLLLGDGNTMSSGAGMVMNLNETGNAIIKPYHNHKSAITFFDGHAELVDDTFLNERSATINTEGSVGSVFWKGY